MGNIGTAFHHLNLRFVLCGIVIAYCVQCLLCNKLNKHHIVKPSCVEIMVYQVCVSMNNSATASFLTALTTLTSAETITLASTTSGSLCDGDTTATGTFHCWFGYVKCIESDLKPRLKFSIHKSSEYMKVSN